MFFRKKRRKKKNKKRSLSFRILKATLIITLVYVVNLQWRFHDSFAGTITPIYNKYEKQIRHTLSKVNKFSDSQIWEFSKELFTNSSIDTSGTLQEKEVSKNSNKDNNLSNIKNTNKTTINNNVTNSQNKNLSSKLNDKITNLSPLINFRKAQGYLTNIYNQMPNKLGPKETFYCHCPMKIVNNKLVPDLKKCGYTPGKFKKRAQRIEWEHIVPASWFGARLKCWKTGGRRNCQGDPKFVKFEGDMHNLVPSVGEINAVRSNYRYSEFTKNSSTKYGKCYFVVSESFPKAVQPANYTKGFIARTFLYVLENYKISINSRDRKMMEIWNKKYPPTKQECYRNQQIAKIQHRENRFISEKCKKQ